MVFSSNVFLFLFLPIFLGLYYLCPNRGRNLLILIGSYTFYAWWRVDFLLLFAAVTLWNYVFALRIQAHAGTEAALAAVRAGFDYLLLDEIVAFANIRDLRSQRVLQRLGMRDDDQALRSSGIQGDALPAPRRLFRLSRSAPTLRSFANELETSPAGPHSA